MHCELEINPELKIWTNFDRGERIYIARCDLKQNSGNKEKTEIDSETDSSKQTEKD